MTNKSKAILYIYAGGVKEVLLNGNARDNCSEPYINLKESIEKLGFSFEWEKKRDLEYYTWIIINDITGAGRLEFYRVILRRLKNFVTGKPVLNSYEEAVRRKMTDKLVLIIGEEAVIAPDNFRVKYHKNFQYVFTWSDRLIEEAADNNKYIKYFFPNTKIYPGIEEVPFDKKKLITIIAGNKYSKHPDELYSERRNIIEFLQENYYDQFDFYGTGWNRKNGKQSIPGKNTCKYYKSYRGEVKNKWDILPKYKFTLCYENMLGEPGDVTEKIFDALRCKTVPVYLGAPNISYYVDAGAYIDRSKFNSDRQLLSYLENIGEDEYKQFRNSGENYLKSNKFKLFLSDNYVSTIVKILNLYE